jgi:3-oxoacyl-[acyl-carrier-protein] synthase-3
MTSITPKLGIKILGTGSYKPDCVVTNDDFSTIAGLETDNEWIVSRTGITQRRFNCTNAGADGTNFAMLIKASKRAIESAKIDVAEIDMVVVSTASPDFFYPSMSCLVQGAVGAVNAFAIDINAACTGFVNALDIARNYIAAGSAKKVLVVAGEMLSNQVDFNDRTTCILFGDGAGAVVAEAADKPYYAYLGAIGDNYCVPALHSRVPYRSNTPFLGDTQSTDSGEPWAGGEYIQMDGKGVYKFATEIMPKAVHSVIEKSGWSLSDIDLLIPHQANIRIIKTAMKSLDIPMEKVYVNIADTGNISSACVPVCLDELYAAGRIQSGMKVCIVAFGAGLTYGSILMEV